MLAGGILFYPGSSPMLSSLFTFLGQLELEKFPLLGSPAHL